jgi:uncharacterized low-complexity protein
MKMNTLKLITTALVLAMVSTAATASATPHQRPAHEPHCTTVYLDDTEPNEERAYKCTNEGANAPQITCGEGKVAIMFADHKYYCTGPFEWIGITPEDRGAFDPNAGPYEE